MKENYWLKMARAADEAIESKVVWEPVAWAAGIVWLAAWAATNEVSRSVKAAAEARARARTVGKLASALMVGALAWALGVAVAFVWTAAFVWAAMTADSKPASTIKAPPGYKLLAFAQFLYSKKSYTIIFEPIVSDLQDEHIEALAAEQICKARWVLLRGYWSFWAAVVAKAPLSLVKWIWSAMGPG